MELLKLEVAALTNRSKVLMMMMKVVRISLLTLMDLYMIASSLILAVRYSYHTNRKSRFQQL